MQASDLITRICRGALLLMAVLLLAACQESGIPKDQKPVSAKLTAKMEKLEMDPKSPIYIRAFKESSELEVWKQRRDGQYALLTTYSICKWSGKLGPKIKEGDRQAPEGFYTITRGQMNPNSSYYLSFNIGFPNAFDRSLGRTGTNIMVHGACSSAGCYSMTDEAAGEIYALARDAFYGGQRAFEVHLYPFRMTPENMAKHRNDPNFDFWVMLKEGNDHFEVTKKVPVVQVCNKRYVFDVDAGGAALNASAPCPPYSVPAWLDAAVKQKQTQDNAAFQIASARFQAEDQAASAKAAADAQKKAAEAEAAAAKAAAPAVADVPAAEAAPALAEAAGVATAPASAESPDVVMAAVGGVPAPEMPLPVPSPLRPVSAPAAETPPPAKGNFLQRLKIKMPWG
ncbi:L,D-transpeptidase family protein [Kaistia algarum]|uniref:L,D-transpeptidase family protein n=1 Tax=Kaistia algarum TaxID=2083279 RepID=UPI001A9C4BD0|nr:murein L,D-transpeptidase family protein [Kaistia algarum]MCX5514478.1 murein L,D-transpeptidase [Kaistia algarum]